MIWSKPGEKPIPIKISGGKEDGFVLADDLLNAMTDDNPWEAYGKIHKEDLTKSVYAEIVKADEEKRLIYGIVLEPDGVDSQNDTVSKDEIEHACHVYMKESRTIGDSHKGKAKSATVVESYIAPTDFSLGGQDIKEGTWIMVVKIDDDATWDRVKRGDLTGFSIGGFSKRIPVSGPASERIQNQIPYEQPAPDSQFPFSNISY